MDNTEAITFTHNELVQILLDAQADDLEDNGVMTGPELAAAMGISDKTMQKRIRPLLREGVIEVAKKQILNSVGIRTTVRGYRLVEK